MSTIVLGALISRLECRTPNARLVFDFCGLVPTHFMSWRGIYSDLAIGFADPGTLSPRPRPTVATFLDAARKADGSTFTGYKGGEYVMSLSTPVWVENYGEYTQTAIVSVVGDDHRVVLVTRAIDAEGSL